MTSTKHQPPHDLIDLERIFAIYYEGCPDHDLPFAIPENSSEYHNQTPATAPDHVQASDPRCNECEEPELGEKQLLHLKANGRIREGARARLLKRGVTIETNPLKSSQLKCGGKCHSNKRSSGAKRSRAQKTEKKARNSRTTATTSEESPTIIDEWREFFSSLALEQSLDLSLPPYKRPSEVRHSNMSAAPFEVFDIFEHHLEKPQQSNTAITNDSEFYELIDLLEDSNSMSTTFEFPIDPSSFDFF